MVRFCVTDTGRLLSGDAWEVLHKDICAAFLATGDQNILVAGIAIFEAEAKEWEVRLQGIGTHKPAELLPRLITWPEFVSDANWKFVPYGVNDD